MKDKIEWVNHKGWEVHIDSYGNPMFPKKMTTEEKHETRMLIRGLRRLDKLIDGNTRKYKPFAIQVGEIKGRDWKKHIYLAHNLSSYISATIPDIIIHGKNVTRFVD